MTANQFYRALQEYLQKEDNGLKQKKKYGLMQLFPLLKNGLKKDYSLDVLHETLSGASLSIKKDMKTRFFTFGLMLQQVISVLQNNGQIKTQKQEIGKIGGMMQKMFDISNLWEKTMFPIIQLPFQQHYQELEKIGLRSITLKE